MKYILWIPAAVLRLFVFAQGPTATITGIVRDAATQQPIPLVNVYFDNTTIGSTTDSSGRYLIADISADLSELTFSFVGYKTIKVPDLKLLPGTNISVDVKMAPAVTRLAPITITSSSRNDWSSKYKRFKKIFLGTTPNASKTEILNPEVLSFEDIESDIDAKDFIARASAPLLIENRALGYHITVFLEDFQSIGTSYNIIMSTRFDKLTASSPLQDQRWKKNRLDSYKGSQLHLFRSIADGSYEREGFRIFTGSGQEGVLRVPAELSSLILDSTKSDLKILRKGAYQIHYYNKPVPLALRNSPGDYYPVSIISVVDDYLRLYPNGQVKQPSNYWRSGYLYNFRFGDLLPSNYDAVVEEGRLTVSAQRELTALKGTVVDERGAPLSDVEVFINNGIHHTTTNAWGRFEITNLHPGKYPIAFADDGMQELIRMIDLSAKSSSEIVVEMKEKPVQSIPIGNLVNAELQPTYVRLFWNTLFTGMGKWSFVIDNPYVLQFARQRKMIKVWTTSPLIIENARLGYTWTYFISDATIRRKKLNISGVVKMDTLKAQSQLERRRWENNRLDEYRGSWNHLISSLVEGQTEAEGFQFYQLTGKPGNRTPLFEKLDSEDVRSIAPDSILFAKQGALSLNVLPGLEVHNSNIGSSQKFYKRQSNQVLRLSSDSSYVAISRTGSVDPADLRITGQPVHTISTVPLDHLFNDDKVTDPNVLLYVKEENLKAVKNLLEKVYIHTDRPYYYPGDTIWFKAYLRYSNRNYRDSLSDLLYAELLNPAGNVISSSLLKIIDGVTWGDMAIASNVEPADYYLRVYTNWMRNFDEFMIRPLPIISRKSFIQPGPVDTVSTTLRDVHISLTSDKPEYSTRDNIGLHFTVSKDGLPLEASFSITVTDQSVVSDLEGIPNILSMRDPFKADGAELIRLSYPVERGITLNGRVDQAGEKSEHIVTLVLMNGKAKVVTPTIGRKFSITVDFVDTTTAVVQCINKNGIPSRVEFLERPAVESSNLPSPLSYSLLGDGPPIKLIKKSNERVRVLEEVTVGSKPIPNPQATIVTTTQRSFGMAYQVFKGTDLSNVRLTGDLINFLTIRAPQFHDTYCWIQNGQPCSIADGTPGSRTFAGDPLASIFAGNLPSEVYSFILNGIPLSPTDFSLIPTNLVSRVEVFWTPGKWGIKKIAIYTEPSFPHDERNFELFKVKGYSRPHVFRQPPKEHVEPDYRPTIYWNPSIDTGPDGKASVWFTGSDVDGTYKVTVEGVTSEGEFFRATKYLNITR